MSIRIAALRVQALRLSRIYHKETGSAGRSANMETKEKKGKNSSRSRCRTLMFTTSTISTLFQAQDDSNRTIDDVPTSPHLHPHPFERPVVCQETHFAFKKYPEHRRPKQQQLQGTK